EWNKIIEEIQAVADQSCVFLQSCHIFGLANMLRRPVIILGLEYINTVNEQQAQLNDLVGIYLPLLTTTKNTHHHPIVLSYCHNHFTPLVISENESLSSLKSAVSSAARPLLPLSFWSCSNESTGSVLVNLPVHYTNYLEELNIINLLKKHLNIEDIITDEGLLVRCCSLSEERLPEDVNLLDKYVDYLQENIQPESPEVDSSKPDDLDVALDGVLDGCSFKLGDVFKTFMDFKQKLDDYSKETGAMFRTKDSLKLKEASDLVYKRIDFQCCHGGKIRSRSAGIRPQQHHMALNCQAKIRLYNTGEQLKITIIDLKHNHKVDQANMKFYARNRRLDDSAIELIKNYDQHKVPRSIIRNLIMDEKNIKFNTVKDIANVLNKTTSNNSPSQNTAVRDLLNEIKLADPTATVEVNVSERTNALEMIFIASKKQ
ncbi:unnamed protein product, partial [Didymodactylos carnosus]